MANNDERHITLSATASPEMPKYTWGEVRALAAEQHLNMDPNRATAPDDAVIPKPETHEAIWARFNSLPPNVVALRTRGPKAT
jgi:hypothetical protein